MQGLFNTLAWFSGFYFIITYIWLHHSSSTYTLRTCPRTQGVDAETGRMFSAQQVEAYENGLTFVSFDALKVSNFLSVGVYARHLLLPSLTYP